MHRDKFRGFQLAGCLINSSKSTLRPLLGRNGDIFFFLKKFCVYPYICPTPATILGARMPIWSFDSTTKIQLTVSRSKTN
jgi:hypothetical protein